MNGSRVIYDSLLSLMLVVVAYCAYMCANAMGPRTSTGGLAVWRSITEQLHQTEVLYKPSVGPTFNSKLNLKEWS
jgi:hypothetical protein